MSDSLRTALGYLQEDAASTALPDPESQFSKGARAGTLGMGSSLRNALGAGAEALGAENFAAGQFAEADQLAQRAQQTGPRVGSLRQLADGGYSLRDTLDYAKGVIGGAGPSIALGTGAALATGGAALPALAGATAAFTPFEIGDAVAKYREANPDVAIDAATGLRLGATGLGSAALQSVVPAMVGGKIMGKGLASTPTASLRGAVGRNLAEIPMEGATEGAGELVKQLGATPDAAVDWAQVGENAVAGAIGGAPMSAIGAGADYARGNAGAMADAGRRAKDAVAGALPITQAAQPGAVTPEAAVTEPAPTARSAVGDVLQGLRTKIDDTVDRVSQDGFLGDMAEMAKATPERALELSRESGTKAAEFATKWGTELMDRAGVDEATRAKIGAALDDVGNSASQQFIAAQKKTFDAIDKTKSRVTELVSRLGEGKADTKTKKSEDYAGARKAIGDVLGKYKSEIPAETLANPELSDQLSDGLRRFVEISSRPGKYDTIDKHWVRAQLGAILGPRSTDILNDVYDAVGSSEPDAVARRYQTLNELDDIGKRGAGLVDVLTKALPEGSPLTARQSDDAQVLGRWARGELTKGMSPQQAQFEDRRMRDYIAETYGDKAETVLGALESDVANRSGVTDQVDLDEFNDNVTIKDEEVPSTQYIGGNDSGKVLVTDPLVYRAKETTGLEGSTERLIKKLQTDNPGAGVRFVSVRDKPELLDMIPSLKADLDAKKASLSPEEFTKYQKAEIDRLAAEGKGMIEVTSNPNPDALSQADLQAMRMDTNRFGRVNGPSRLEVKANGVKQIFDAVKVARAMTAKINRARDWTEQDDVSDAHRMARAFNDGVAQLMEKYGHFEVPPTTLIGRVNGKDFTAADIKKLPKDAGENFGTNDRGDEYQVRRTAPDPTEMDLVDELSNGAQEVDVEGLDSPTAHSRSMNDEPMFNTGVKKEAKQLMAEASQKDSTKSAVARPPQANSVRGKPADMKPVMLLASKLADMENPIAQKVGSRLQTLAENVGILGKADAARLQRLAKETKVSEVGPVVNELARKYADRIVPPKGEASFKTAPFGEEVRTTADKNDASQRAKAINDVRRGRPVSAEARADLMNSLQRQKDLGRFEREALEKLQAEKSASAVVPSKAQATRRREVLEAITRSDDDGAELSPEGEAMLARIPRDLQDAAMEYTNLQAGLRESEEVLDGDDLAEAMASARKRMDALRPQIKKLYDFIDGMEGSPDPKAQAAKKAAFLERAASGDAALIRELNTSNDAKGLQRAAEALIGQTKGDSAEVLAAVNDRLATLMQDPDTAYGMGTKKYSLQHAPSDDSVMEAFKALDRAERDALATGDLEAFNAAAERAEMQGWSPESARSKTTAVRDAVGMRDANKFVVSRLAHGRVAKLGDLLRGSIADMRPAQQVVARAVSKIAGGVEVEMDLTPGQGGVFNWDDTSERIGINTEQVPHAAAFVLLHEGVHAATVRAMRQQRVLLRAADKLMMHAADHDYTLMGEYGFTDAYEFVAEGLANPGLQERLRAIPGNKDVSTTLKDFNLWDAFVDLIKRALGVDANIENVLTQLIDLSSAAMHMQGTQKMNPSSGKKFSLIGVRPEPRYSVVVEQDDEGWSIKNDLTGEGLSVGGVGEDEVTGRYKTREAAETAVNTEAATDPTFMNWAEGHGPASKKYSLLSTQVHNDLERGGFAATHDSPVQHAGKFDWRKHAGAGAFAGTAYGAGTYLSTGDTVHAYYKKGSTLQAGKMSPTYHVSVQALKAQLINWDKPLSEQSSYVKRRMEGLGFTDQAQTGAQMYKDLSKRLGGDVQASDALQDAGIVGHGYSAVNGRDAQGNKAYAPNYVIYDDSKILTNYVHFSAQKAAAAGMSAQAQMDVQAAIDRMLGKSVKTEFANLPHAGEFESVKGAVGVDDVIRVSVHALDPTSTAYHESLHALFAKLMRTGAGDVASVLQKATNKPAVAARLRELLAGEPAALRQLNDPEERAAYMFQFWAQGDAKLAQALTGAPETFLQRLSAMLRKVLGTWSNEERALHIMEAFSQGQFAQKLSTPGAFRSYVMDPGRNGLVEASRSLTKPLTGLADAVVGAGSARLRESGIPSLQRVADTIKAPLTAESVDAGYLPAARLERTARLNDLGKALQGLTKAQVDDALATLQTNDWNLPGVGPEARLGAKAVGKFLRDQLDYLTQAGVDVKDLGEGYFPRVYDTNYISKNQDAFKAVLQKHGVPEDTMHKIISAGGSDFQVEVSQPGMQARKQRRLANIPDAELAPFMQKDLYQIMSSYITQATRRAEWARRFGDDSRGLNDLLDSAKKEGASKEQLEAADKYIKGVNGTLGDDINPTARRLMGDMIVYQNIRLLPLAIFSSVVDPMGIIVRGGEVQDAWKALKRGIKEIPKGLKGDTSMDSATALADTLGVIDNAAMIHDLGALYSQGMVGDRARKINDTFFRFNLMEQFNRSMRVGATEAALKFMEKHSTGAASAHSARWMRELGLMKGDVKNVGGRVAISEADGLTTAQAARVRMAVNRWVDGAVLRPDAADKPIWMNDPHWALVSHLKQFVYAFHHTILKRVVHEYKNGNATPAMALASYVPIMIAADLAKGMLTNGGDEPEWKKGWGPEDYIAQGVQRAGLLGVGQLGVDAWSDVNRGGTGVGALVGPTIEQLGDALEVMGGSKQFESFALKSMPANALYADYVRGSPDGA